jgi:hypothetical protein
MYIFSHFLFDIILKANLIQYWWNILDINMKIIFRCTVPKFPFISSLKS